MNRLARLAPLVLLLGPALPGLAQEEGEPEILPATDTQGLLEREGQTVTVRGHVIETNQNLAGIHFLNFRDAEFVCVTFSRNLDAFTEGPPSEIYKDKYLAVTGPIEDYRGKPQIKLESPGQVEILDAPPEPEPEPEPEVADAAGEEPGMEETPEPATTAGAESPPAEPEEPGVELVDGKPPVDWRQYFE